MTIDELNKWVDVARWAPSGGNAQPWQLRIENLEKGEIVLFVDPEYRQHPSCMDFDGSATLIGLGAFVESLSLIVDIDNYFLHVGEFSDCENYFDFSVKLKITEGSQLKSDEKFISSLQTFTNRVTNRTYFLPKPIPQDFLDWMKLQANKLSLGVKDLSGPEFRPQLMQLFEKMEKVRWESQVCLTHLLEEMKESADEDNPRGIPFHQLDIKWSEILLIKTFKNWPFTHSFLPWGTSRVIAREAVKKPLSTALFFSYLVTNTSSAESFFNLGRCLQRIWLAAEEKGLALQPMANHLMVYQALKQPEKFNLTSQKKRVLESVYTDYKTSFGVDLFLPAFGFRLGYPSSHLKPSFRRSVDKIIDL